MDKAYFEKLKTWLWEGLKTTARYLIIWVAPIALDAAIQGLQTLILGVPTLKLDPTTEWFLRGALAFADKALHEAKKDNRSESKWTGLLPF